MADIDRRTFLQATAAAAALPLAGCVAPPLTVRSPSASAIPDASPSLIVNDIHSQLNATEVDAIVKPRSADEAGDAIARARSSGLSVAVAGGRHAMGGQQFGEAGMLVDTRALNRVLALDAERGVDHGGRRHPVAGAARSPEPRRRKARAGSGGSIRSRPAPIA